jgi:hypothetical protein
MHPENDTEPKNKKNNERLYLRTGPVNLKLHEKLSDFVFNIV